MTDIVERAAKAAWEEQRKRLAAEVPELQSWEDETEELRDDWRSIASQVILQVQAEYAEAATFAFGEAYRVLTARFDPPRTGWDLIRMKPGVMGIFSGQLINGLGLPR
jgi:hypothetical protein